MLHIFRNQKDIRIYIFLSLLFLSIGFFIWNLSAGIFPQQWSSDSQTEVPLSTEIEKTEAASEVTPPLQKNYEFTAATETTAEELLNQHAQVEYRSFGSGGKFIQSINGLAGSAEYFWGFYVNDAFAEAGVSQTNLEAGDTIRFTYESIDPLQ